jgi:hypothetical protein
MSSQISRVGAVPGGNHGAPSMQDKTDSVPRQVKSGANIKKVTPGLNNSIVPLIPDHHR